MLLRPLLARQKARHQSLVDHGTEENGFKSRSLGVVPESSYF